jgi:hypothetical protein
MSSFNTLKGTHKHRFDEDGKGRGIEGRSDAKKTAEFVNRDPVRYE